MKQRAISREEPTFDGRTVDSYTVLVETLADGREQVMMSDYPSDAREHEPVLRAARRLGGRVLVHGLGLALVVMAMLELPSVEHADVVELERDVIELVRASVAAACSRLTDLSAQTCDARHAGGCARGTQAQTYPR